MTQPGAWEKSLVYLTSRPRTERQVKEYLLGKGYDYADVEETITRLKEANYLNDLRFAEGFARARSEGKLHGRFRLRRDMISRGVSPSTADKALDDVYTYIDEDEILERALGKWLRINGIPDDINDKKRLNDYLFRLGFEPQAIISKIRTIGDSDEE
jgi:regulatory protein